MRLNKKGKLGPCFISLFEILDKVGTMAYWLVPLQLLSVQYVPHFYSSKVYNSLLSPVLDYQPLEIQVDMTYIEWSIHILHQTKIVWEINRFCSWKSCGNIIKRRRQREKWRTDSRALCRLIWMLGKSWRTWWCCIG